MVPDVIADDWKKWWEAAKKELKKDGHFQLPTKKSDPIIYQQKETSLDERLLTDFRAAKGLKAKIGAANEFLKTLTDINDKPAVAVASVALVMLVGVDYGVERGYCEPSADAAGAGA